MLHLLHEYLKKKIKKKFSKISQTDLEISRFFDFQDMATVHHLGFQIFSVRYNIYISRLCYDVSVRLSVCL